MAFTQITSTNLSTDITTQLAAGQAAAAAVANIASMAVKTIQITDSSYNALDDTAANTGGGYVVITGTGFTSNCIVIVGSTNATSTTYVNSTTLRAQIPAASAATYTVYVVDTSTGATAIKVNGLTYSAFPAWSTGSTLTGQSANTSFGISLSATSDSNITYANTTVLPTGTTLLANGYFYGTVTIGSSTTYSFDVKATDVENQDVSRTFSLTVTVSLPKSLFAWGALATNSNYGILGQNNQINYSSPTQIGSGTNWVLTSTSAYTSFGIKSNGTLWGWGYNGTGTLGLNDRNSRSSPTQIGALTNWSKVSAGPACLAIKTDGTLWGWGDNSNGVAQNSGTYRSSPTQIGALTTWSKVHNGGILAGAIRTDGTLWTWGSNYFGSLGLNYVGTQNGPGQVPGTWSDISSGNRNSVMYGVKTDGTLWSWGRNDASYGGPLGLNDTQPRSRPTQIGLGTTWLSVSGGYYQCVALKTDGTMWTWGQNGNGNGSLGLGINTVKSSPTQVGTDTNWAVAKFCDKSGFAQRTDGTLWVWGKNDNGQLGLNNTIALSSPVQLGTGTNWALANTGRMSFSMVMTQ